MLTWPPPKPSNVADGGGSNTACVSSVFDRRGSGCEISRASVSEHGFELSRARCSRLEEGAFLPRPSRNLFEAWEGDRGCSGKSD